MTRFYEVMDISSRFVRTIANNELMYGVREVSLENLSLLIQILISIFIL